MSEMHTHFRGRTESSIYREKKNKIKNVWGAHLHVHLNGDYLTTAEMDAVDWRKCISTRHLVNGIYFGRFFSLVSELKIARLQYFFS